MVEEDRYCADILDQIASVQKALRGVQRSLMRNHLEHCATKAIREGSPEQAKAMYDELIGDPKTSAGQSEYEGRTYYFGGLGCKRKFEANPSQFAEK